MLSAIDEFSHCSSSVKLHKTISLFITQGINCSVFWQIKEHLLASLLNLIKGLLIQKEFEVWKSVSLHYYEISPSFVIFMHVYIIIWWYNDDGPALFMGKSRLYLTRCAWFNYLKHKQTTFLRLGNEEAH